MCVCICICIFYQYLHLYLNLIARFPFFVPCPCEGSSGCATEHFVDAACTLGAWLLNVSTLVVTYEATRLGAVFAPRHSNIMLQTLALAVWASTMAVLLPLFQWVIGGNFHRASFAGVFRRAHWNAIKPAVLADGNASVGTNLKD